MGREALGADGLALLCEGRPIAEVESTALSLVRDNCAELLARAGARAPPAHAVRVAAAVAADRLAVGLAVVV